MQNEKLPSDPNPMPEIRLFEVPAFARKISRAIGSLLVPFHCEPHDFMSTHNTGAAPMLDRALDMQLPFDEAGHED